MNLKITPEWLASKLDVEEPGIIGAGIGDFYDPSPNAEMPQEGDSLPRRDAEGVPVAPEYPAEPETSVIQPKDESQNRREGSKNGESKVVEIIRVSPDRLADYDRYHLDSMTVHGRYGYRDFDGDVQIFERGTLVHIGLVPSSEDAVSICDLLNESFRNALFFRSANRLMVQCTDEMGVERECALAENHVLRQELHTSQRHAKEAVEELVSLRNQVVRYERGTDELRVERDRLRAENEQLKAENKSLKEPRRDVLPVLWHDMTPEEEAQAWREKGFDFPVIQEGKTDGAE